MPVTARRASHASTAALAVLGPVLLVTRAAEKVGAVRCNPADGS